MFAKNKIQLSLLIIFAILSITSISCKKTPTTPDINSLTLPVIWLNTFEVSFTTSETGHNPSNQILKIKNSGPGTLNYTISDDADWMTITPASGSSSGQIVEHTISVDKTSLAARNKEYSATITVTSPNAYNNPQKVTAKLKLEKEPPPKIEVTPESLSFSTKEGSTNLSSQTITVKNEGQGTLNYTISDDASWLNINPKSGICEQSTTKSHTVSIDISGLSQGTYNGTITISDPKAKNSPQTVNVSLNISKQSPPQIWVSTSSLSFSAKEGGANPSSKSFSVKNSSEGTLSYSISDDASWLSVSPSSGSSKGGTKSHAASINISGLSAGTYKATITISDPNASNSPQTISVTLTINQQSPPQIWTNTKNFSFEATVGGSDPSSQTLRIKNSGEGTLDYTISDDASWLTINPASGSSSGGENRHTVSVDIDGLSQGTYTGTIAITDPNASNSPQEVNVSLELSSLPSDNKISISCSPSSGGTDTIVSIPITISGNQKEIKVFGLELTFDSSMFEFQSVNKGSLTGDWAAVDGNETQAGTVKVGGFAGSGKTIGTGSIGTIAVVKLKVICTSCSNGQQTQLNINNYTDDISGMSPEPDTTKFTYTE